MPTITEVKDCEEATTSPVFIAKDVPHQVQPEVEDAAFQALAFENAESWL